MKKIYIGALTGFTYPIRQKDFLQLIYHDEEYIELKLLNIQNKIISIF